MILPGLLICWFHGGTYPVILHGIEFLLSCWLFATALKSILSNSFCTSSIPHLVLLAAYKTFCHFSSFTVDVLPTRLCTFAIGKRSPCIGIVFEVMQTSWSILVCVHLSLGSPLRTTARTHMSMEVTSFLELSFDSKIKAVEICNDSLVFHLSVEDIVQLQVTEVLVRIIIRAFHSVCI